MARTMDARSFANRVVRRLGRPEVFDEFPLLKNVIEFGCAVAFEQYRTGLMGERSPGMFALSTIGIINNQVLGAIEPIPSDLVTARPALREAIEEAIHATIEKYQNDRRRAAA